MIQIWRGDLSLAHAIASGRLKMHGPSQLKRAVPVWLGAALPHGVQGSRRTEWPVPPTSDQRKLGG
jgi:hypothetical protein